jgi:hypothetical protein
MCAELAAGALNETRLCAKKAYESQTPSNVLNQGNAVQDRMSYVCYRYLCPSIVGGNLIHIPSSVVLIKGCWVSYWDKYLYRRRHTQCKACILLVRQIRLRCSGSCETTRSISKMLHAHRSMYVESSSSQLTVLRAVKASLVSSTLAKTLTATSAHVQLPVSARRVSKKPDSPGATGASAIEWPHINDASSGVAR